VNFFGVTISDLHQLNLGPFGSLRFLKFIKNMCFFHFSTIKSKCFMYLKKKPIPNERERDFIVRHCIIFSDLFL
jgi:hypothetical protein